MGQSIIYQRLPVVLAMYLWRLCVVWPAVRVCIFITGAVSRMAYGAALRLMWVQIWVLQVELMARRAGGLAGDLVRAFGRMVVALARLAIARAQLWCARLAHDMRAWLEGY